jgi:hypothetical protein
MQKFAIWSGAALLALTAGTASAQATRTWVSGVGDDANPCSRTAPCKTFPGAISKTAPGGEISVLDPGGFGTINITKSISIDGTYSGQGSILATLGINGVIVNAGPNDIVNLRGISIEGAGSGGNGIRYIAGGALHVQNVMIRSFRGGAAGNNNGILVNPTGGNLALDVNNTVIEDNGTMAVPGAGIAVVPTGAATVKLTVSNSQIQNNTQGIKIDGDNGTGAIDVMVSNSQLLRNAGAGFFSTSPNGVDSLVRAAIYNSTSASNGGPGIQSAGQRSTVRVAGSTSTANSGPGLQGNNNGALESYGDNYTAGNGAANTGVTTIGPS